MPEDLIEGRVVEVYFHPSVESDDDPTCYNYRVIRATLAGVFLSRKVYSHETPDEVADGFHPWHAITRLEFID